MPNDGLHCVHWYDDDGPRCRCGYDGPDETACEPRTTLEAGEQS